MREKIRYHLFCVKWRWKNRNWEDNRHKFKAMDKDWAKEAKR